MMHEMKGPTFSAARPFHKALGFLIAIVFASVAPVFAQTNYSTLPVSTNVPGWITQPLSMVDALNLTLKQNSGLQKARADLESSRGLVIETRAIALPTLSANGRYTYTDPNAIQQFPFEKGTNDTSGAR